MRPGFKRSFEQFKILTPGRAKAIHQATLRVLEQTGVAFNDSGALDLFESAGCSVDRSDNRVRIPQWLVEDSLAKTGGTFRIRARDPKNDVLLSGDGDRVYFCAGVGNHLLDPDTGEVREPTRKEFYDHIKVLDALPNLDMLPPFPFFGFAKVPQALRLIESQAAKIRCSTKVSIEGGVMGNDEWNIKLAQATGQDVSILCNPAPPLSYTEDTVADIFRAVEADMPFWFSSGPVGGATGPATLAGLLVSNNAENMAGMVLAQLKRPGGRIWIGSFFMTQNMATGGPCFGSIENMLAESAFHQLWRGYNVPAYACAGAWTGSKAVDYQAGYEQSLAVFNAALAGAPVLIFQGGFTGELAASTVKAIIDDEVAGMIGRYLAGIRVDDETLAVDLIDEVGPLPGDFLRTKHTREWWRKEQFMPQLADRGSYDDWLAGGKKGALDKAREKMDEILTSHQPAPLSPEQETAVESILNEARQWYRENEMISDEEWEVYQEDLNSPDYPFA